MTDAQEREKNRLLGELQAAADVRDRYKHYLQSVEAKMPELEAALRKTHEAQCISSLRKLIEKRSRDYNAACESHDQVESELLTALTGMDLFDVPGKAMRPAPTPAEAVAS